MASSYHRNPASPPRVQPPAEDELDGYFFGLPSRPRLVARTDSIDRPWIARLHRTIAVVTDRGLIDHWTASKTTVADDLRRTLAAHRVDWSLLMPVVVGAKTIRPGLGDGPARTEPPPNWDRLTAQAAERVPAFLVGVRRETCAWQDGLAAATACRAILAEHLGVDLQVYVVELGIVSFADADADAKDKQLTQASPASRSSSSSLSLPQPLPTVLDLFDPCYGEMRTTLGVYKHPLVPTMEAINNPLVRLLPFPGQLIQQVVPIGAKRGRCGTLSCFVRLATGEGTPHGGLYGLASRHVVVGDRFDHDQTFAAPPQLVAQQDEETKSDDPTTLPVMPVAWGSNDEIAISRNLIEQTARTLDAQLNRLRKFAADNDSNHEALEQLELCERCVQEYVPSVLEAMQWTTREVQDQDPDQVRNEDSSRAVPSRQIGHVAFAGAHRHNRQNGWSDWALVALDQHGQHGQGEHLDRRTSPADANTGGAVLAPPFDTNNVYLGRFQSLHVQNWWGPTSEPLDLDGLVDKMDRAGFVRLSPPRANVDDKGKGKDDKDDKDKDKDNVPPRYVYKRGAMSGVSVGTLSPVEAVLRTPLAGRDDVITWSWPVLGLHCEPEQDMKRRTPNPFTEPGDSGSCVFDATGTIVGMVDGGVGGDKARRLFHMHPGVHSGTSPVPLPTDSSLPPQYPVPEPFSSWKATSKEEAAVVDITLTTPMEWVLEDIEQATGFTPTIV